MACLQTVFPLESYPGRCKVIVPIADKAIVDIRKLTDYCLSYDHPRGRHKARVFQAALGIATAQAGEMRDELLHRIRTTDCMVGAEDEFGARFVVDFPLVRGEREAVVRSLWIIKANEDSPRLTSCFVL